MRSPSDVLDDFALIADMRAKTRARLSASLGYDTILPDTTILSPKDDGTELRRARNRYDRLIS